MTFSTGTRAAAAAVVTGLLYFAAARYVIVLNDPVNQGAGFWPGAGITVAALLLSRTSWWPAVLLAVGTAEVVNDLLSGYTVEASLLWAVANMAEPLLAALLVRRLAADPLSKVRDVLWFVLAAVVFAPIVGGSIGAAGALAEGSSFTYPEIVLRWALGDGLGILTVTPAALLLLRRSPARRELLGPEGLIMVIAVAVAAAVVFLIAPDGLSGPYLVVPPLLWAAIRFRMVGAAIATFIVAQVANTATGLGFGEFGVADQSVLTMQGYLLTITVTVLVVGARTQESIGHREAARIQHRRAEELRELDEANALVRLLLESTGQGLYGIDRDGRCTFANRACADLLGHDGPAALVGRRMHQLVHHSRPDGTPYPEQECRVATAVSERRGVHVTDEVLFRADGSSFPAEYWSHPVERDDDIIGAVVTFVDITEQRELQKRVRESEARFRELFQWANTGMVMCSLEGRFMAVNPAFCRMLGATETELIGTEILRWTHPEDRSSTEARLGVLLAGEKSAKAEKRYVREDGAVVHANVSPAVIRDDHGRPLHTVATIEDITERREAQQQLQQSEALRRVAGGLARMGGWALDLADNTVSWSEELYDVLEYSGERTMDGVPLDESLAWYPEEHRQVVTEAVDACARLGTPFDIEVEVVTFQGRRRPVRLLGEPDRAEDGSVGRVVGAMQDISEQHRTNEALREREARLAEQAALLDEASDAIVVRDLEHRFTYWNRGAEILYGWSAEEALGQSSRDLLPDEPSAFDAAMEAVSGAGEWHGELTQRHRSGREIVTACRWTLVRDDDGEPRSVLAINTDITEQRMLEEHFLRAQRLESIGTLAGGLAHDLNNTIAPIVIAAELLKAGETDDRRLHMVDIIAAAADRAGDMVQQILMFARGFEGRRVVVDVEAVLSEVERLVEDTFLKSVRVVRDGERRPWKVMGDTTQLHQVLVNLCLNARDAMPNGGTLRLSAQVVEVVEEDVVADEGVAAGPHVRIRVQDDGIGMSTEVLARMFEPFFTTKAQGEGTGLGCSTSAGIIKSHGGFIRVTSQLGQGTTVDVHLPTADPASEEVTASDRARPTSDGTRTVLVVDDEDTLRSTVRQVLERGGYAVLEAADGAAGVAMLAERSRDIDIVLTDMMMPGMDGATTIQRMRDICSDIPVVAMSGMRTSGEAGGTDVAVDGFLAKPFSIETLLEALSSALERRPWSGAEERQDEQP